MAGLLPAIFLVGAPSSILDMAPPIRGLVVASLRDSFEEIHNGRRHEAIDILEPRGTPVRAVVSGTVRKLFRSKPGGNTLYQFDDTRVYCYYYAHLDGYVEGLREGMWGQEAGRSSVFWDRPEMRMCSLRTCILRSWNWGRGSYGGRGRP